MEQVEPFEEVYAAYWPLLVRFCLSLCGSVDLAEDLAQESFLAAFKALRKFRGESSVETWLCGIAKNHFRRYCGKNPVHIPLELLPAEPTDTQVTPFEVEEAIRTLPPDYAAVLRERAIGGLEYSEISRIHGKSESWARVTYHRAHLKLQSIWEESQ